MNTSYTEYFHTTVHQKLVRLADEPYDLTCDGALEAGDRLKRYVAKAGQFSLHYWGQRVTEEVLEALQNLADECQLVEQFLAMKGGAVMNSIAGVKSEDRQVLHCSCRDLFSKNPNSPQATELCRKEVDKLAEFLQGVESGTICNASNEPFETMIHVGIGGSDLGPRAIYEGLKNFSRREVHFIANVDPDDGAAVLGRLDLSRCLVTIVSKSGTTLETLANETLVRQALLAQRLDPAKHLVAVTGKDSPMDNPKRYLKSFYMFDFIGGRYSCTSMVGAVMLGFSMGFANFMDFLQGAANADILAEKQDITSNISLLLALLGIWNHNYLGMTTLAVLPYCQALHRFPAHLQQCDMESNGKSTTRAGLPVTWSTGPVVWGEPGTNGQHAFYQLLHQGCEVVPCEFIGFRQSQRGEDVEVDGTFSQQKLLANMLAQAVAMATGQKSDNPNTYFPGNRPNSILVAERLTPRAMGELLALYEAKIVFQGFCWNINSFDQEGVQLGKVLATRFLQEMKALSSQKDGFERNLLDTVQLR